MTSHTFALQTLRQADWALGIPPESLAPPHSPAPSTCRRATSPFLGKSSYQSPHAPPPLAPPAPASCPAPAGIPDTRQNKKTFRARRRVPAALPDRRSSRRIHFARTAEFFVGLADCYDRKNYSH